jgi:hypothetical protein
MQAFLQRFPGVRLDPARLPARRRLPFFRGFTSLPVLLG